MREKSDKNKISVLKALHDADGPAGASKICEALSGMGMNLQPRTVRFYLLQLDREELTRCVSRRRGRELTEKGLEELSRSNVMEKVGFVAAKVDSLGYRMTFNLESCKGSIVTNVSFILRKDLGRALQHMEGVFAAKLGMGGKLMFVREGQRICGQLVPKGKVAFGTVCSVSVNGIMLDQGVPVTSRFGGLVEIKNGQPARFVELIEYGGTTVDPLEVFIKAGMTKVLDCAATGSGIVGASFREIPSVALDDVRLVRRNMDNSGLSGIIAVGKPNRPLLDIPVAEGRTGIIVIGGLNPIAALHEAGVSVDMHSLAGLEEFSQFIPYKEAMLLAPRRGTYID